jgi:hypothetical protein
MPNLQVLLLAALAAAPPPAAEDRPVLDRATVPAAGRQQAQLTVGRFGRYALSVKSAQGTSVQVVDRMAGPGESAGRPGEEDGRIDVFLERGEYRLLTEGHARASGEARLGARGFTELSGDEPRVLLETRLEETTLDDYEQRSYWLVVKERRRVMLEAAGRNLADLRLWRDGQWLVDAYPLIERLQPKVGQPLLACRLATDLEPGVYRVTAYGGAAQPWAEEGDAHPLYMRFGLPRLPEAGRRRFAVSPFGVDRYLVPGAATYFRLELAEALPATLRAGDLDPEQPFAPPSELREITKKSLPPVAELDLPYSDDPEPRREDAPPPPDRIVTVEAEAGQAYTLQHFDRRSIYAFRADGAYFISSIHSGHPQDSVDATALLVRGGDKQPLREDVVELDPRTTWRRRANLLAPLTVFLRVKETGRYEVLLEGPESRARIEPFFTWRPARYQPPAFRGSGSTWDLDAGFYVLTAEPVKRGIVTFTVRRTGASTGTAVGAGVGATPASAPTTAVRAGALFPSVTLDRDHGYTVYLNEQPEVRSGVQLRKLPLDPTEPLFVAQRPGETVTVPVTIREPGLLKAQAEDGALLDVVVDGDAPLKAAALSPGAHSVMVRHEGRDTVQYSLVFEPARLARAAALPALPPEDAPVAFETLVEGAPRFLDLAAGASATYNVRADAAGLYVLESTGLLQTEGNLRSRVVTSFARESGNGAGRNFELRQYLREGDYQLTVSSQPPSAGHLGVQLRRTRITEGGFLLSRLPARASIRAGDAVAYRFTITTPGDFRVRALGLGRAFRCRLEDENGWPLVPPGGPADVTRYFDPGRYRFVVLPQVTDARVVSLIEPVAERRPRAGHGPHTLPLGETISHAWLEPEEGQERRPDVWTLALPAASKVTFALGTGMKAVLVREEDAGEAAGGPRSVAGVGTGHPAEVALEAGRYRLEVRSTRPNNRFAYTVGAFPDALLPGMDRSLRPPAEVPLAIGALGLVEISSFGGADVKARLYDAVGNFVAASDDRADDWNFQIAAGLLPGRYLLRVDPVGAPTAATTVRLRVPREEEKQALTLPASTEIRPGRTSLLFPLASVRGDLLLAQVRSTESVGLAVEAKQDAAWMVLGSTTGRDPRLEVPHEGGELRLRLWSLDRRDTVARLSVVSVAAARSSEGALARGLRVAPIVGLPAPSAAALVEVDRPGLFRLAGAAVLRVATEAGVACRPVTNGLVAIAGKRLYVVTDTPAETLRAERVTLGRNGSLVVDVPSRGLVPVDVVAAGGPLLVRARSRSLQPGVWLGDATNVPEAGAMAVSSGLAQSISLEPRRPLAVVFAATPPAPGLGPVGEATLEAVALPKPQARTLAAGITDVSLAGVSALSYALPEGAKRLRIALSRDGVAVLAKGSEVEAVVAADAEASALTLDTTAPTLLLLQTAAGEGRFSVETLSAEATVLGEGRPVELAFAEAGERRLTVGSSGPATLRVRGALEEATFVGQDGTVRRGRDMSIAGAGTLLVRHNRGPVVAWLEREGESARRLWAAPGVEARTVGPPAEIRLEGPAQLVAVEAREPALLHFRSATPLVTVLARGEVGEEAEVHAEATSIDAFLPRGRSELLLRPVLGRSLFGTAELQTTPLVPIGEGLGPEVLLPPGGSRGFSFQVERGGPVGLGVRASAAVVEATLLDADGRRLGTGVTQMPTLAPGEYSLVLHAPSDGPATRVRPAVAGLARPSIDPPMDVVRRYLEPDTAGTPAFSSRYVEDVPEAALGYEEGGNQEEPEESFQEGEEVEEEEAPPPGTGTSAGDGR